MLQTLINAKIPLIFVETDEPERVNFENSDKDWIAFWKEGAGITYELGGTLERISSTGTMEAAITCLKNTKKKYLIVFYGEPEYKLLQDIPDYHTLVFVNPTFEDYTGAVRITLPLPEKADYFNAFHKICKTNKILKDFAGKAIGMKVKDAANCFRYSLYTKTDFLKNKHLFTKSIFLDLVVTKNTFDDLGGFSDFKKWFNDRRFWYKTDMPKQRGVLLYGPSGTGKSLCASCLGNEADIPLYRFDLTKVYDQYVGRSEEKIRQALAAIEKVEPAIIWVEEINRLFPENAQLNIAHHQVLAIFLEWLQEHDRNIFIVATANKINHIPFELVRPGRFNERYKAECPAPADREEIFKIHMTKHKIPITHLDYLVNNSTCRTGAEIEQAVKDAAITKNPLDSLRSMF